MGSFCCTGIQSMLLQVRHNDEHAPVCCAMIPSNMAAQWSLHYAKRPSLWPWPLTCSLREQSWLIPDNSFYIKQVLNSIVALNSKGLSKGKRLNKLKLQETASSYLQQSIAFYYGEQQNLFGFLTASQTSDPLSNHHSLSGHFDSVSLMWRQQGAGPCLNSSPVEKKIPQQRK